MGGEDAGVRRTARDALVSVVICSLRRETGWACGAPLSSCVVAELLAAEDVHVCRRLRGAVGLAILALLALGPALSRRPLPRDRRLLRAVLAASALPAASRA